MKTMETKNHKTFKPFDKVLVRVRIDSPLTWVCTFYSHLDNDGCHVTAGAQIYDDNDIIPYEGNEHLVGTTDNPDEEVILKAGEFLFVSDSIYYYPSYWCFIKLGRIGKFEFRDIDEEGYVYAIRFSDFNPNDMEETKKHILRVKYGKVVRYKE